jgi:hypothetical protein
MCAVCGVVEGRRTKMDINRELSDSGKIELLRLMMKREDWDRFVGVLCERNKRQIEGYTISLYLITDTTGLLAQAAVEFLRRGK